MQKENHRENTLKKRRSDDELTGDDWVQSEHGVPSRMRKLLLLEVVLLAAVVVVARAKPWFFVPLRVETKVAIQ